MARLLTIEDLAAMMGWSKATIYQRRYRGASLPPSIVVGQDTVLQPESDLVPIALIAVEVGESVDRLAHRFGEAVTVDDIGMRAVRADAASQFFTERAEWKAQHDDAARRRREELAEKSRPLAGVPAQEGMTPFEAMAAAGDLVSPSEEFGGRPSPNFLEEELAAGRRVAAEKEALVKKMKDGLT